MKRYVRCPVCDRVVTGYVPAGGDGSGLRVRHHLHTVDTSDTGAKPIWENKPCPGRFETVTAEVDRDGKPI